MAEKYTKLFYILMFGSMSLMIPMFIFIEHISLLMATMLTIMGATIVVLPFVTSVTTELMGVRRGVRLGRTLGISMIIFGLIIIMWG
jgi:hypothetical protein